VSRSGPDATVPAPLLTCIEWLNKNALQSEGLYRVSGSFALVQQYKNRWDSGDLVIEFPPTESSANVAGIVMRFLMDLPENLFGPNASEFGVVFRKNTGESERLSMCRSYFLNVLEDPYKSTLKFFVHHLHLVASRSEENKMTAKNLAISIYPKMCAEICFAISHYIAIWETEADNASSSTEASPRTSVAPTAVSEAPSAAESQPVTIAPRDGTHEPGSPSAWCSASLRPADASPERAAAAPGEVLTDTEPSAAVASAEMTMPGISDVSTLTNG